MRGCRWHFEIVLWCLHKINCFYVTIYEFVLLKYNSLSFWTAFLLQSESWKSWWNTSINLLYDIEKFRFIIKRLCHNILILTRNSLYWNFTVRIFMVRKACIFENKKSHHVSNSAGFEPGLLQLSRLSANWAIVHSL